MYVVTLSVFHNLAIWLLYVNKPEPERTAIKTAKVTTLITTTFVSSSYAKNCSILNCQMFSLLVVENYFYIRFALAFKCLLVKFFLLFFAIYHLPCYW